MAKKAAYYGCMLSLAIIAGYIEMLIPFDFGIPGIKLGLGNIVAIFLLYKNGLFQSLTVNVARIVICGILFGNVMSVFYAFVGGALSLITMVLVKKTSVFSAVGVSVSGGVAHNIGQLTAALTVISFKALTYYLPFLMLSGVATGFLVGIGAAYLLKRVNLKF